MSKKNLNVKLKVDFRKKYESVNVDDKLFDYFLAFYRLTEMGCA